MAKRVLAVDDSRTIRQLIKMTLSRAGYEVVEAEDGAEGLRKANEVVFDMMLIDVKMPGMNGLDMLRSLRQLAPYKFTPIILVTTEFRMEKKREGKAAGATGWIVKPFGPEQLLAVVTRFLQGVTL